MSANTTKPLGFFDAAVAYAAAKPFRPKNVAQAVRAWAMWAAITAVFVWAAIETTGALSILLWTVIALRSMTVLALGLAERAHDERLARLDLIPETYRAVLRSEKVLVSKQAQS